MAVFDQLLAKTNNEIKINMLNHETIQNKIQKKYLYKTIFYAIIAIVFGSLWIGNVYFNILQICYIVVITMVSATMSVWDIILYIFIKKIDIYTCSIVAMQKKLVILSILSLSDNVIVWIGILLIITLYIQDLWFNNNAGFWTTAIIIVMVVITVVAYVLSKYLKLFRKFDSICE